MSRQQGLGGRQRRQSARERDAATQVAALVHCLPYIGFPLALNAIRVIQDVPDQPTT